MQTRKPVVARPVVTLAGDGGTIHLPYDVGFDPEIVEAAGRNRTIRAENDAAVVFFVVSSVDVVNIETGDHDVSGGAKVIEQNVYTPAHGGLFSAMVGDFEMMNFDFLEVAEQDRVFDSSVGIDAGTRPDAIAIENDRERPGCQMRGRSCSCQTDQPGEECGRRL